MNQKTHDIVSSLNYQYLDALEISGRSWKKFGFKSYKNFYYPEFDICNVSNDHFNSYDIIIAEQVFEHIRNPYAGVKNVHNILKVGGFFLITTPFFLRIHDAPGDYWRWTPDGLSAMLEDNGFEILVSDSWGNKDCIVDNFYEWTNYKEDLNLNNEKDLPMMVWCLGKKV
jgi:SAM-dependent methyltransferase